MPVKKPKSTAPRKKKQDDPFAKENESAMRIKIMQRYLRPNGFQFEWGFYPFKINTDSAPEVESVWNEYNRLVFIRGCLIAHRYMNEVRHIAEETQDNTELKIDIMQERYG